MSYIFRYEKARMQAIKNLNVKNGFECFGMVVRTGYNLKTTTVRVLNYKYSNRYKLWVAMHKNIHVHDPFEMSRLGDKVYIRFCGKISTTKSYFIKSYFNMAPRISTSIQELMPYEKQALVENEELRNNSFITLNNFFDTEREYPDYVLDGNKTDAKSYSLNYYLKAKKTENIKLD